MAEKIERLIKAVYRNWKSVRLKRETAHPDEETLVCFIEGRLPARESRHLEEHLLGCARCIELLAAQISLEPQPELNLPRELLERMRSLVPASDEASFLEVVLKLGQKAIEILGTTGDVLVGFEFVPAPVLRSRRIKDFKDEVSIVKDFADIRVEIKIENRQGNAFDLMVFAKDKQTQHIIRDLRITLLKGDLELESYLTSTHKVVFEHVSAGQYTVEISAVDKKVASVLLDVRR